MRRLLAWIILLPLAVLILLFAVANRAPVTVSLDPFSATAPAYAMKIPLFLVVFAAMILGVIVGGTAMLRNQFQWWRAARRAERETARLKEHVEAERIAHEEADDERIRVPPARLTGTG
jgi:uncharacterized integral membrane protein